MAKEANPHEIEKFPIKLVKIGNEIRRVRYDAENKVIYRLNDDDSWDGSFVMRDYDSMINSYQENDENGANDPEEIDKRSSEEHPTEDQKTPPADLTAAHEEAPAAEETVSTDMSEDWDNPIKDAQEEVLTDIPKAPAKTAPEDPAKDVSEEPSGEEPEEKQKKKKSPIKAAIFPILCVVLFAMIGLSLWGSVRDKLPQYSEPATPATDTSMVQNETVSSDTENPSTEKSNLDDTQPSESVSTHIQVLAPNITLIPGQELTAEIIDYIDIPTEEYQQLTTAAGIYTSEELVSLEGLIAQNYIPAGRYLTYEDIGRSYSPSNPWAPDLRDAISVMLPISPTAETLQDFIWGNRIDLTITIQTKQTNTNDAKSTEETAPDGLEHESSVVESMVIDTYKLQGVQIADILDAEQQSLYSRYTAISAIPGALQVSYLEAAYSDTAIFQSDIPTYIIIAVTQAQADIINALDTEAMAITVSNPTAEYTTSLQYDTLQEIHEVVSSIAAAWPQLSEEGAAE